MTVHQQRLAVALDRTAHALLDMASELQEIVAGLGADAPPKTHEGVRRVACKRIRNFWHQVRLAPVLQIGEASIDLKTPQGRWELMALALLKGARVKVNVVEETFVELKKRGLLEFETVIREAPETRQAVAEVLEQTYKALGHKQAKLDALFVNGKMLYDTWQGDLNNIYLRYRGEDAKLLKQLRSFRQIDQIAFWICRTLKVHGVWPYVGSKCVAYMDRYTHIPVERLNLARSDLSNDLRGIAHVVGGVVSELFDDDTIPLYLHGLNLCSQDDVAVCLSECPVSAWCSYPQKDSPSAMPQFAGEDEVAKVE